MKLSTVCAFGTLAISIASLCYNLHVYREVTRQRAINAPAYITLTPAMMHERVVVVHHYHD
jgi:cbb3-type cytochrome oxidase subunit 3